VAGRGAALIRDLLGRQHALPQRLFQFYVPALKAWTWNRPAAELVDRFDSPWMG
jgi:hypothetical protein